MPGYISEVDYDGGAASNFIEIVVPKAYDTSAYTVVIYDNDGTIIDTFSLGSPVNTIAGKNVFLIDDNTPGWVDLHNNEAVALVDDSGTVLQFIAFKDPVTAVEGPANGMSATQIGEHSGSNKSLVTADGGSSYAPTPTSTPGTVPYYAPGTLIATPSGPRAVETLKPGDLVTTLDHGPRPVRWVNRATVPLEQVGAGARPILIRAGALGDGLPKRDLIVSPQHRILVGEGGQLSELFTAEAFAPAKSLTLLTGIRQMNGKDRIEWIHFACDRHEVVHANGCLSESLLLGQMVVRGMSRRERHKLLRIFGRAATADAPMNGPPARACLTVSAARRILETAHDARCFRRSTNARGEDGGIRSENPAARQSREADKARWSSKGLRCAA